RERYLEIVREIRAKVRDVVISTDVIVGFPGETEEDFEQTLSLYDEVGYEQAYMFIYSARPGTPSYKHFEDMPREVKTERLARLIRKQKEHSLRANQALVGRELRVLVKEVGRDDAYVVGHSDQNHTVLVPREQVTSMGLKQVRVEHATPHALYGRVASPEAETYVPLAMAT
ncbi:MAG TPA: TRAM domain-containing protein, partial [Trueperaceae bacterium]|nr:TRAM domain-containing protein [Trueperaceae bacterium]